MKIIVKNLQQPSPLKIYSTKAFVNNIVNAYIDFKC